MAKFLVTHGRLSLGHGKVAEVGAVVELPESMAACECVRMIEADGALAPPPAPPAAPEAPAVPPEAAGLPVPSHPKKQRKARAPAVRSEPEIHDTVGQPVTGAELDALPKE